MALFNDVDEYGGFSWHSVESALIIQARMSLNKAAKARQTKVVWAGFTEVNGGFFLPWKEPGLFRDGYAWFSRHLGHLVANTRMSPRWYVIGHAGEYDGSAWDAVVAGGAAQHRLEDGGFVPRENERGDGSAQSMPGEGSVGASFKMPEPFGAVELSMPSWRCKCPMLKLTRGPAVLQKGWEEYDVGKVVLGEGSYSKVHVADRGGVKVAVKILKHIRTTAASGQAAMVILATEQLKRAMEEVCVLERCAQHPHIVQLLDVGMLPGGASTQSVVLVFERWGRDVAWHMDQVKRASAVSGDAGASGQYNASTGGGVGPTLCPSRIRQIIEHATKGAAFLHSQDLIHTDIKPANILAVVKGPYWHCKLADVGCCVSARPGERGRVSEAVLKKEGIQLQTLWYRAPEILFGMQTFGDAVDAWSMGMVAVTLAGFPFGSIPFGSVHRPTEVDYYRKLFHQLGTPLDESLVGLPLFPKLPPKWPAQPFPPCIRENLGEFGLALVWQLLAFPPSWRLPLQTAVSHPYLRHEAFPLWETTTQCAFLSDTPGVDGESDASLDGFLARHRENGGGGFAPQEEKASAEAAEASGPMPRVGRNLFEGKRHPWNLRVGRLQPEVLGWLRADSYLTPGTPENAGLHWSFTDVHGDVRKYAKLEEGRKFVYSGSLGECATKSMCALSLERPLPCPRLQAWKEAFINVNSTVWTRMDGEAKAEASRRVYDNTSNPNLVHFLQTPWRQWFASAAELCLSNPGNDDDGHWVEPKHQDGGGSVVHMGLTLYGRRRVLCWEHGQLEEASGKIKEASGQASGKASGQASVDGEPSGQAIIKMNNVPGTVYLGCLTGPWHQVCHQRCRNDELLQVPGLGACSLTVMLRTALFPHCRSRTRNTTPSPPELLRVISDVCSRTFATEEFRFPTLQECEACVPAGEHAEEGGLAPASGSGEAPRKRMRKKGSFALASGSGDPAPFIGPVEEGV